MSRGGADERANYYQRYFPHSEVCGLLGRGWRGKDCLHKRELCIDTADDVKIRWLSCSNGEELKELFKKKSAAVFHNGAVYSDQPCFKKKGINLEPVEREFVMDIDINDYDTWGVDQDDVDSCDRAWPIVAIGFRMVKHILREHFGFKHMLLVYSGRRGAHLSVYDGRACVMNDQTRDAIVKYLQPQGNATEDDPRAGYRELLDATGFGALFEKFCIPFWKNFCLLSRNEGGMGVLDGPFDKDAFMQIFGDSHAKATLTLNGMSGAAAWDCLCKFADDSNFKEKTWHALHETVLCYVWPRLDAAVSEQRQHLSKSMFSLHAKTGRVCLPVFGDSMDFDPSKCPHHHALVQKSDTEAERLFFLGVSGVKRFLEALQKSAVEAHWVKSSLDTVHTGVYSMVGDKRRLSANEEGGVVQCHPKRSRVCGDVLRVYSAVASSANPTKVTLGFHTELCIPSVCVIPAGYSIPFRATSTFPMAAFARAVATARKSPGTEVECDRAYVCVDFCKSSVGDLKACRSRMERLAGPLSRRQSLCTVTWKAGEIEGIMERLAGPLSRRQSLCTVNANWKAGEIEGMLSSQVKEHWNLQAIQMQ